MTFDSETNSARPGPTRLSCDERYPADRSVVLRYAPSVLEGHVPMEDLLACSRREGIRILDLGSWRGINLKLLDESSAMASGTYKSLDGCLSTAMCRHLGIRCAVFSSGANAGSAISLYGSLIGLESFFFCPIDSLHKVDGALFDRPSAHLVAVEGSDRRVKQAAKLMSELIGAALIPTLEWRTLSAGLRGMFLAEQILRNGQQFHWIAQSICAGYGPLGIYRTLGSLVDGCELPAARVPRLLAIQQEGLCPIVRAWERGAATLPSPVDGEAPAPLLEPALYNTYPEETYPALFRTLGKWGGFAATVGQDDLDNFGREFLDRVEGAGLRFTRSVVGGSERILERAGLLAGAGVLKMISQGRIAPGQTVLCALTGGIGPAPSKPASPIAHIRLADDFERAITQLAKRFMKGA